MVVNAEPSSSANQMPDRRQSAGDERRSSIQFRRSLRLHNGVAMILGTLVGSGIFITPPTVLAEVGSAGWALVIWAICGLVSTLGAYCYCELGTMIKESGGDYAYIKNSFPRFMAFLCLWGYVMIAHPIAKAVKALTFARYFLYPFLECSEGDFGVTVLAILVTCLLTAINCVNVNWAHNAQVVFTITKVITLIS